MKKTSKTIGLVAHDNRKRDLIEWVDWNAAILMHHRLICTGTTGRLVEEALRARLARTAQPAPMPEITKLKSGPLGGDQQLGAMIAEGRIDVIIFFWDPMEPHPHDVDVKALLRIAVSTTSRSPATAPPPTSSSRLPSSRSRTHQSSRTTRRTSSGT